MAGCQPQKTSSKRAVAAAAVVAKDAVVDSKKCRCSELGKELSNFRHGSYRF
jgi:hypothetical protein